MLSLPKIQIVSVAESSLALAATDDRLTVEKSAPNDLRQQWQLIYYPEMNAVALMVEPSPGTLLSLYSKEDDKWPTFTPFRWDTSHFWMFAPMGGNEGVALLRDPNYSLTITGGGPWKAGDAVQVWGWHHQDNQKWHGYKIG